MTTKKLKSEILALLDDNSVNRLNFAGMRDIFASGSNIQPNHEVDSLTLTYDHDFVVVDFLSQDSYVELPTSSGTFGDGISVAGKFYYIKNVGVNDAIVQVSTSDAISGVGTSFTLVTGDICVLISDGLVWHKVFHGNYDQTVTDGDLKTSIEIPNQTTVFVPLFNVNDNDKITFDAILKNTLVVNSLEGVVFFDGTNVDGYFNISGINDVFVEPIDITFQKVGDNCGISIALGDVGVSETFFIYRTK